MPACQPPGCRHVSATATAAPTALQTSPAGSCSWVLQMQADLLQVPVSRPRHQETTSLGAAIAAGIGVGFWTEQHAFEELREASDGRLFQPQVHAGGGGVRGPVCVCASMCCKRWCVGLCVCVGWCVSGCGLEGDLQG